MPVPNRKLGATNISLAEDIGSGVFSDMSKQLDGIAKNLTGVGVSLKAAYDISLNGAGWNGYDGTGANGASMGNICGNSNSFIPYDITYPGFFEIEQGLSGSDLRNNTIFGDGHVNSWDSRKGYYCLFFSDRDTTYLGTKLFNLSNTGTDLNNNPDDIDLRVTQSITTTAVGGLAACTAVSPKNRPSEEQCYSFVVYRNNNVSGYDYFAFTDNDYLGPAATVGTFSNNTSYTNCILPSACYGGVGTTAGYDVALYMRLKNNSGCQVYAVKRNNNNNVNSSTSVSVHSNASNFSAFYNGGICCDTTDGRFYGAYGEVFNATSPTYASNLTFIHGTITPGNGSGTPTLGAGTAFNLSTSNAVRAVNCDIIIKDDTYNWILVAYSKATDNNIYYHVVRHTRGTNTFSNFASGTLYNGGDCNINQRIKIVSHGYHYITTEASGTKQVVGKFTLGFVRATGSFGFLVHGWFNTTTGTLSTATDDGTAGTKYTGTDTAFPYLFRTDFSGNADRHLGINATYTEDGLYQVNPAEFTLPGKSLTQLCVTNMFAGVYISDVDDIYGAWYYQ